MDPAGRYVDVSAADLVVLENGDEQKIETFQDAVDAGIDRARARCQRQHAKGERRTRAAAREFVEALRPEDQLAVMFFSDGIVMSHDFAKNRQEALDAIDAYKSAGGTALYDALASSLTMLKRQEGRRAVVVMTDGRDENNAGNCARQPPDALRRPEPRQDRRRGDLSDRPGIQRRSGRLGAVRRHLRRSRVLSVGGRAPEGRVPADDREPPATLCDRLHLDARGSRRLLARRGDPFARRQPHRPQPQRVLCP